MFTSKNGLTILIVDDEVELAEIMSEVLQSEGYTTFAVNNLADAIEAIHTKKPNAIISDLRLPDGSGASLRTELKRLGIQHLPLIFVTGYISGLEFKELSSDEMILHKPVNFKVLQYLLEKIYRDFIRNSNPYVQPMSAQSYQETEIKVMASSKDRDSKAITAKIINTDEDEISIDISPEQFNMDETIVLDIQTVNFAEDVQLSLVGCVFRREAASTNAELLTLKLAESSKSNLDLLNTLLARQQAYVVDYLKTSL